MAPALPPLPTIEWDKLGLAVTDSVNGHVECTYSTTTSTWSPPTFVTDPYLRIHGLSPALNYGMQAFEGLKALRLASSSASSGGGGDTISIFRPHLHCTRLAHSATVASMPPVPEPLFLEALSLAVRGNAEYVGPSTSDAILYIRPLLFGSGPQLALEPPSQFTFAVYVQPATTYHGLQPLPCVVVEDFDRAATRGTGSAKIGGNYAPVMRWSRRAKAQGYYMTLHLDSATQSEIDEFSTSGFIGVKKIEADTPANGQAAMATPTAVNGEAKENPKLNATLLIPSSPNILHSVTSDSVVHLAQHKLHLPIARRPVPFSELASLSEVLAVGTAASVLPIASVSRLSTDEKYVFVGADGKAGEVGVELAALLKAYMRGEVEDEFGWRYEVGFLDPEEDSATQRAKGNGLQLVTAGGEGTLSTSELKLVTSPL
ncbi:hypothetical protein GJ744_001943 [Endocarpon pusillum]|uniref:Branched-chain-amino-acid aminotransferase TOXF n=1 Tax=Endocarpon pusillum TaxID=364733 RepID=A0A8H7AWF2_9EURO|nr:hypothetical protein GJ744_001943 [Endocarpon pusillum]